MRGNRFVAGALALSLGAGLAVLWVSRRPASSAEGRDNELEDVRRQLAALKTQSQLQGLALAQQAGLHAAGAAPAAIGNAPDGGAQSDPSGAAGAGHDKRPAEITPAQIEARVESVFSGQVLDPAWSQTSTNRVNTEVAKRLPAGSSVQGVDCRSTLCQIKSSHQSRETYQKFVNEALFGRSNGLWNAAITTFIVDEAGGGVSAVSYVAREGENIPAVDGKAE